VHCNAFAAKGIIRSPITSRSRRDHSVSAALAANGIGREGGDGSAQRGQNVIYDCLVCFCISPGSAEALIRLGGKIKYLFIPAFSVIFVRKNHQNQFMCVRVIARQSSDIFNTAGP